MACPYKDKKRIGLSRLVRDNAIFQTMWGWWDATVGETLVGLKLTGCDLDLDLDNK